MKNSVIWICLLGAGFASVFAFTVVRADKKIQQARQPIQTTGLLLRGDGAQAELIIVEKDGYKFAVLLGTSKAALVQIK